jgi:glycoside/pentoside/hexuronide:cation symporter, GPH family
MNDGLQSAVPSAVDVVSGMPRTVRVPPTALPPTRRNSPPDPSQKLSFLEKSGYGAGDAAANFVYMAMILFQANFYTDVLGITANQAAIVLLVGRLWDAVADPVVGMFADRTSTRWGKFRPWILYTTVPWCVAMILAYTTPAGWSAAALVVYATLTNILLMTVYSMNNTPYAALGGVMSGDVNERAKLNSVRFVAVNLAQFVVGGLTLPLVAKFAATYGVQRGWQITMTIWAIVCLILFLITFVTTRERVQPQPRQNVSLGQDLATLIRNPLWLVMFLMTICHFTVLSFRGASLYNYYHHYADKAAMYDWVQAFGLTEPAATQGLFAPIRNLLGYVVHGDRADLSHSNVADVFNSLINLTHTVVTIIVILLSSNLAARFGKKAIAVYGFGSAALATLAFYFLRPGDVGGMIFLTVLISALYAPTVPLIWAIYADVADYSEWKGGRRLTGMTFATIGFALKCGLALGSSSFLWFMVGFFDYDAALADAPRSLEGFRVSSGLVVGFLLLICTALLTFYKLDKRSTLEMSDDLTARRQQSAAAPSPAGGG